MNANDQKYPATPDFLEEIGSLSEAPTGVLHSFRLAFELTNSALKRRFVRVCLILISIPLTGIIGRLLLNLVAGDRKLTQQFVTASLHFYRNTRAHRKDLLIRHQNKQQKRVLLSGVSELTEIAFRCAQELGMEVVGVYAPGAVEKRFLGKPVWSDWSAVSSFECCMVTDLQQWARMVNEMRERIAADRLIAPNLIGLQAALL